MQSPPFQFRFVLRENIWTSVDDVMKTLHLSPFFLVFRSIHPPFDTPQLRRLENFKFRTNIHENLRLSLVKPLVKLSSKKKRLSRWMNEPKLVPKSELHNCKHEQLSSKGREVFHLGFVRRHLWQRKNDVSTRQPGVESHFSSRKLVSKLNLVPHLASPSRRPELLAKIDKLCRKSFPARFHRS